MGSCSVYVRSNDGERLMHQSTCRFIGGCAVLFDEGDRRKKSFQDALDHRGIFVDQIIAREDQVRMKMRREALRFDFAALNGFGRLCDRRLCGQTQTAKVKRTLIVRLGPACSGAHDHD
jgi:hypothetical protein